jgi:hypothetical protein
MKKRIFVIASLLALTGPAGAAQNTTGLLGANIDPADFAAPVLKLSTSSGTINPANQVTGMIIFDLNSHQFKGLDDSGNWDAFSVAGGNPVTSGANERIERAHITNNGTTCAVTQDDSWLTGATRSGPGVCVLSITTSPAVFTATPSCVVTPAGEGANIQSVSTSGFQVTQFNTATNAAADSDFDVICMAP